MKRKIALILSMMMLICLPGCGEKNADNSSENNTTVTQETAENEESEADETSDEPTVVRMSISSEPDSLDPWQSAASDTSAIFSNVFEGLLSYNEKGEMTPGLAESWDISEDGLVYT